MNGDKYQWLGMKGRINYILFAIFAVVLFAKCILFHWDVYHSILISALWKNPIAFYKFYMAKLLMPLFIASFILISKHRWWTIAVCVLTDIWSIANLIYYKTYDSFLSVSDMLLAGNMGSAWTSVPAYIDKNMVWLIVLTLIWIAVCILYRKVNEHRRWKSFGIVIGITIALSWLNSYLIYNSKFWSKTSRDELTLLETEEDDWIEFVNTHGGNEQVRKSIWEYAPYYQVYKDATAKTAKGMEFMTIYVRDQSILSYFGAVNIYYLFDVNKPGKIISLSEQELQSIGSLIHEDMACEKPNSHLIIIVVESLEDWPLHHPIEGHDVAPNLRALSKHNHVLYCSKIKDQTRGGNSGDGQMIINTGLLPLENGVACMHYGDITYPNIAHRYDNAAIVNPWPNIWNQDTMSVRYGYQEIIEPQGEEWQDEHVLQKTMEYLKEADGPTCVMAITVSTHSPFNRVRNNKVQTHAPSMLNKYMQCLNYTDSCIGAFMDEVMTDRQLSQSTIVITGDHTIFKSAMLAEFAEYAAEQDLSIASGENYCPLIMYSPQIEGNVQIDEECYQMDIFPTVLGANGGAYFWRGLGRDLQTKQPRRITEDEAFTLSDRIIRSNYFGRYR